jgi:ubiquinone/menaquinone biosynthesis C-methylase UbiE
MKIITALICLYLRSDLEYASAYAIKLLQKRGLRSDWHVLDDGCGPMRLGVKLISKRTEAWCFGQDINAETLEFGRQVLQDAGVGGGRYSLLSALAREADFRLVIVPDYGHPIQTMACFRQLGG